MLQLTRAFDCHIDLKTGKLTAGPAASLALGQVPVRVWVTLAGRCDRASGFVVNVVEIDQALRAGLAESGCRPGSLWEILAWAEGILGERFSELKLAALTAEVSEGVRAALVFEEDAMMQLTTRYEFAASHRLWNQDWDETRNVEAFGKCANAAGHGHNYVLEVTLAGEGSAGQSGDPQRISATVRELVIDRFDHKNLNEDVGEFTEIQPTVENIARACWDLLVGRFGDAKLVRVAVWETPKTYAEYFGAGAGPLRYGECVGTGEPNR